MTSTRKVTLHPAARAAARSLKSKVATATTRPAALSTPPGASADLTGRAAAEAASRLIRATLAARAARPALSQRLVRRFR